MPQDIAALVGSRICHDLISPVGAISNGVELLSLTDGDPRAEMALISESVENASARIKYFRIAYGATSADQMVSRNDVMAILSAVARGGRFTYFWQVEGDQSRQMVRAAFLIMQCLESAMPLGGDITLSQNGDKWTLSCEAERLSIDAALWASLSDPTVPYDHKASQVQFALLPEVVKEAGRKLHIAMSETSIKVTF